MIQSNLVRKDLFEVTDILQQKTGFLALSFIGSTFADLNSCATVVFVDERGFSQANLAETTP